MSGIDNVYHTNFAYHSDICCSVYMFHTNFFTSVATHGHSPSVCIGMQYVGHLSSYLLGYKTTSSTNITSMYAYECNAYVLCLHTSKGMKPHRTPPWATYDAKLYRYGRTIGHDKTSDANESCNIYGMLHLSINFTSFRYNTNLK
jgi:hypothetical protein